MKELVEGGGPGALRCGNIENPKKISNSVETGYYINPKWTTLQRWTLDPQIDDEGLSPFFRTGASITYKFTCS